MCQPFINQNEKMVTLTTAVLKNPELIILMLLENICEGTTSQEHVHKAIACLSDIILNRLHNFSRAWKQKV